ncbi:HAD family hydrolase [Chungangia koreensis]|uniref:HAD family hydrolase n=1 Tax=Chungangia koreensis TaxID=752657 RepID=A0ABV8X3A2_9LACT
MKKWITFDLDGTLMQNPFVGQVFPEIERLVLEKVGGIGNVLPDILAEHTLRIDANRWVEAYDWDDIVSTFLRKNNISDSIDIEKIVCQYCHAPSIYLLEDEVIEVLNTLKKSGYALAAVTNGYLKYQKPVMDALQLTPLFDIIITPSEAGYAKPDPRIFNGVNGEIAFHVGDRLEHDVRSAYEAGVPSVLINRSLPEKIQRLPIVDRVNHSDVAEFLLNKLNCETKMGLTELPHWGKPTYIIHSIKELVILLSDNEY